MQTLNARFVEAFQRATVEPVWLVTLEVGDTTTQTWKWVSGSRLLFGHANSVSHVSQLGGRLDPLTREVSITAVDVVFHDATIRDILAAGDHIKTKKVTLALGTPDLAEEDFEVRFTGVVDDNVPEEAENVLRVMDTMSLMMDTSISGDWIANTPGEVLFGIVEQVAPDEVISVTSFDAIAGKEHWLITRTDVLFGLGFQAKNGVNSPERAKDVAQSLAFLMRASLVCREDGVIYLHQYDPAAASVRTFTREDISSFRQLETMVNTINRCGISFCQDTSRPTHYPVYSPAGSTGAGGGGVIAGPIAFAAGPAQTVITFEANDTTAQSDYAYLGEASRVINPQTYDTAWLNAFGELYTSSTYFPGLPYIMGPDIGEQVHLRSASLHGFCGSSAVWADATHTVYLKIDDEWVSSNESYFIDQPNRRAFDDLGNPLGDRPYGITYVLNGRGLFGTVAATHIGHHVNPTLGMSRQEVRGTLVYDCTIAVSAALDIVSRFSHGIPICEVTVPLGELGIQLGDFVSIEDDVFVMSGIDGANGSLTWEVIGKDERVSDDSPGLALTLALVPTTPVGLTGGVPKYGVINTGHAVQGLSAVDSYGDKYVSEGAEVTTAGLTATVSAAVLNGHGFQKSTPEFSFVATASKDSYLSFTQRLGVWELQTLDTGDPAPTWAAEDMPIAKLAAGVASIVVTDLRNPWPFDGRKLADASVEERKLAFKLPGSTGIQVPIEVPGWRGTTPLHVASVHLQSGLYAPFALLGTATETDTGYLRLVRRTDGVPVTPTISHTGLMEFVSSGMWTIPATDRYDIYIWASSANAIVLARDLWIK